MSTAVTISGLIRGLEFGFGSAYIIDETGIVGLGTPPTKTNETDIDGRDGSYAGPEFMAARPLSWTMFLLGTSQADAMNGLAALNTAFAPANDGADVELDFFNVPGWGDIAFLGRPRGVDADLSALGTGTITVLCQFVAEQPAVGTPT